MPRLRVHAFSISLDGYGAGPAQTREVPLGVGGEELHEWMFPTRTFRQLSRKDDGETGVDDDFTASGFENIGAWIMGRNMFGPVRGPWPDESWRGWWGEDPPYHGPVFVLTHHARPPQPMKGGTTFHFVTDGIESALRQAFDVSGGRDVRIGGGASTIRQYLEARLIDEMHVAVSPLLLGSGEALFQGIDLPSLGYRRVRFAATEKAAHYVIEKEAR